MHASNLLKVVLKPRSITSSSSGQSLNTKKDAKSRSPRASSADTAAASLSLAKKSTPAAAPAKMSCLCAPTNHAGSFRCRLHRGGQQSWGGKPLAPGTPPKTAPRPPAVAESHPVVAPVLNRPSVVAPIVVENSVSKRLLPNPRPHTINHSHIHRSCDARPSRLSRVTVATQMEVPVAEAHQPAPAPAPQEAPGTVRYLKFTGGAGCASAAVLEASVVAIRKLQVGGKKDGMIDVFGSGTALSRAGFSL